MLFIIKILTITTRKEIIEVLKILYCGKLQFPWYVGYKGIEGAIKTVKVSKRTFPPKKSTSYEVNLNEPFGLAWRYTEQRFTDINEP